MHLLAIPSSSSKTQEHMFSEASNNKIKAKQPTLQRLFTRLRVCVCKTVRRWRRAHLLKTFSHNLHKINIPSLNRATNPLLLSHHYLLHACKLLRRALTLVIIPPEPIWCMEMDSWRIVYHILPEMECEAWEHISGRKKPPPKMCVK